MDLKTTSHIGSFQDSMKDFDYLRQLCYYKMALLWYITNELKDTSEWTFKFYIIAIDTTGSNEIRVFEFTDDQVLSRSTTIVDALNEIAWHQKTGQWEHHKAYYDGDGAEKLSL